MIKALAVKSAIFAIILMNVSVSVIEGRDHDSLLNDGKKHIETGEYKRAVECLGEFLTASDDKSDDPRAMALWYTLQSYAMWHSENLKSNSAIRVYLKKAIKADSSWEYPKKLLQEVNSHSRLRTAGKL